MEIKRRKNFECNVCTCIWLGECLHLMMMMMMMMMSEKLGKYELELTGYFFSILLLKDETSLKVLTYILTSG